MKVAIYFLLLFVSVTAFSQVGIVKGKIANSKNNEVIPFANVVIEGTTLGTSTDIEGLFEIKEVKVGFTRLTVSAIGYETFTSADIQVFNNHTSFIEINLSEKKYELEQVIVTSQRFVKKEESPVSLRSISISEIENSAGVNRDVAKIVQSFPGVAAIPAPGRNDIIVRGGASSESKFYIDDIEIPNINHFATQGASGGTNGILNADFIREINFYSGAFPANKANALSGIFDFKQIEGNSEKLKFRASLGSSDLSFTTDGPIGKKANFIFSVRRSYLSFLFKALGLPFLPTYNDYQFKSKYRIDKKNEITIVSIGALDQMKLDTKIKNPTESQQYILNYIPVYEQWSYTVGGVYKHFRENGFYTLVLSRNMLNNRQVKYLNNDESVESNKIIDYVSQETENKFRFENNYQSKNGLKINYGINADYARYTNNTFQKTFINNSLDTIQYNTSLNFFKYGVFAQISKKYFSDLLALSFGIRTDAALYDDAMQNPLNQISPRFSASYNLTEKISLNANVGRYFELPSYTTMGYKDVLGNFVNQNNEITYINCNHLIAGIGYQPTSNTKFTIEGFGKVYSNFPFSVKDSISFANRMINYGVVGNEEIVSTNQGRVYGAEFLMQSNLKNIVNILISYTYAISEFQDKLGNYKPSAWDNRHTFIITANKKFKRNWSAAIKWRFAGGLPYTPYDIEKSSKISAWDITNQPYSDYNNVNSARFKPFHQLDLRIDKVIYFKKSSLKFYFDMQNAYNFKSDEQGRVTNMDEKGNKIINPNDNTRYLLRTIPSEGSGNILPSIGVIFDF